MANKKKFPLLKIENLHVRIKEKNILQGVSFSVGRGKVHAIMGPNGSGKSTLANVLAGRPGYHPSPGRIFFKGKNILNLDPAERARAGIFLSFQYPAEIAGVGLWNLLRTSYSAVHGPVSFSDLKKKVDEMAKQLKLDPSFLSRGVNEGFSGGEKKKAEILQLAVLRPKLAILDETDSGLDIDALKVVTEGINRLRRDNQEMSLILITHYFRILKHIRPDFVHVLIAGRIVKSGNAALATELEEKGYGWLAKATG